MLNLVRVLSLTVAAVLAGCASRSGQVMPVRTNPGEFIAWSCDRLHDESDRVQKRAAEVAYAVDERAGNNIIALGIGVTVFWPALIAMRPPGPESDELARLKGRHEALASAIAARPCDPPSEALSTARAAALPVLQGERLVYEERNGARGPTREFGLRLAAARRGELEFRVDPGGGIWRQDYSGNITSAPPGLLQWPQLLRTELALGQVVGGEMWFANDLHRRARVRGQVVAVGPQAVAGRNFDVAIVELFGDARNVDDSTRLDGVIVIDRQSGVLLRLDLNSAQAGFQLQRRLLRVEPAVR
jgi:hypothetical protein